VSPAAGRPDLRVRMELAGEQRMFWLRGRESPQQKAFKRLAGMSPSPSMKPRYRPLLASGQAGALPPLPSFFGAEDLNVIAVDEQRLNAVGRAVGTAMISEGHIWNGRVSRPRRRGCQTLTGVVEGDHQCEIDFWVGRSIGSMLRAPLLTWHETALLPRARGREEARPH